jgi:hypothetical protein
MAMINSANVPHTLAVNQSEMLKQVTEGLALQAFGQVGSRTAPSVNGAEPAQLAAALKAASIAHYRRCVASALANGIDVGQYTVALQQLGTGGV